MARASLRAALDDGLAAMDLPLLEPVRDRLIDYLALLVRWNAVYNLTAVRDPAQMLGQHLLDSLSVLKPMQALAGDTPAPRIVDVGSGAGLPGIPLALAWPAARVCMVEPVGKKAAFIRQAIGALGLGNASVEQARIEQLNLARFGGAPDLIVSRAFASLADFALGVEAIVAPSTRLCAMKGQRPDDEIAALPPGWSVVDEQPLHVPGLDAQRHVIVMARQ